MNYKLLIPFITFSCKLSQKLANIDPFSYLCIKDFCRIAITASSMTSASFIIGSSHERKQNILF